VTCHHLHRDGGVCPGVVARYYANGPTYAWWRCAFSDTTNIDQAARAAVECALEQGAGDNLGLTAAGRARAQHPCSSNLGVDADPGAVDVLGVPALDGVDQVTDAAIAIEYGAQAVDDVLVAQNTLLKGP
jgi:hypothetical protein